MCRETWTERFKAGDEILLVDGAEIPSLGDYRVTRCHAGDVPRVGGGIYDAIIFARMPPLDILVKAIEKVYWGGYVIVLGPSLDFLSRIGYHIVSGELGELVLQRPSPPSHWSEEYYLEFQPKGMEWDPETKAMHPSYRGRFENIDALWEGAAVIEYGCGRGEITRLIAGAGAKVVYAVDLSPAAVALSGRFCVDLENVRPICADARMWSSPERVDVIVTLDFVEHVDPSDLLGMFEVWRGNLKPGGLVHIVTPLGGDAVRDHKWAPSPSRLRDLMEKAGFRYRRHVRPDGSRKFYAEFFG